MRLFHASTALFAPGNVLQPGTWGKAFRTKYFFNDSSAVGAQDGWRLASELIVEAIRGTEFPQLPSRFNSLFAHDNEQLARRWVDNGGELNVSHFIYEVEMENPDAPTHRAALNLMSAVNRFSTLEPFFPMTERIARAYWRGDSIEIPEIITSSPLKVLCRIE